MLCIPNWHKLALACTFTPALPRTRNVTSYILLQMQAGSVIDDGDKSNKLHKKPRNERSTGAQCSRIICMA